jgi:serine/threonine protein kinase
LVSAEHAKIAIMNKHTWDFINSGTSNVFDDGVNIIKTPKNKNDIAVWKQKQALNCLITTKLIERRNPMYQVPAVGLNFDENNINGNIVVEEKMKGTELKNYDQLPCSQRKDILTKIAHLINDMAAMEEIKIGAYSPALSDEYAEKLNVFLQFASPFLFSQQEIDKVINSANELQSIPENPYAIYIFAHGDIHCSNMLYDTDTQTLSFVDFGDCRYLEFFDALVPQFAVFSDVCGELIAEFHQINKNPLLHEILSLAAAENKMQEIVRIRRNYTILQELALAGSLLAKKFMTEDIYYEILNFTCKRILEIHLQE